MLAATSPLVEHTHVTAVIVRTSAEWETVGRPAWLVMMDALSKRPAARRVVGVDSEWFLKNPLATVQIASSTHCFVLHLSYLDNRVLPDEVKALLEDPEIVKCGVGISGDVRRLEKEQELHMHTVMDLGNYAIMVDVAEVGKTNLATLAHKVCGVTMVKNKYITRSNWELPMSQEQFAYAADDAVASYMVGNRVLERAVALYDLSEENIVMEHWLKQSERAAATAFKQASREYQKSHHEADRTAAKAKAAAAAGKGPSTTPVIPQSSMRVRVLAKSGNFLFDCSLGRAKFYVEEKGIATVTKSRPENPTKPVEIQLNFENQTKTRLCMYNAVGQCELGQHCPFAHGVEELCPEARALLASPDTYTCAFCLNPKKLMRHAIVPPSFRRYLPKPLRFPGDDDYVPICMQCNTYVRHFYDDFMNGIYEEAERAHPQGRVRLDVVAKCVAYARLFTGKKEKLEKVPVERQEEVLQFILANWTVTRMYAGSGGVAGGRDTHGPVAYRRQTAKGEGKAAIAGVEGKEEFDDDDEAPVAADVAVDVPDTEETAKTAGEGFDNDWESLESDDTEATLKATANTTASNGAQPTHFVEKNGARIPVRDTDGNVNEEFLAHLSHVVPGDVRARVTMHALVGSDAEKAAAFVKRWRTFCCEDCGMVEKKSNHMTSEDWERYSKESKVAASHAASRNGAV